jgi:hypothetical protein
MSRTKKTVSANQLAANRANAAQSTGPRTPEGKSRSAQNSRKHGFTASTFAVVRLEDIDSVARLKEDLVACYQPVNSQELFAIERIALAQQALLRSARLENGMFTTCLNESLTDDGRPLIGISPHLVDQDNQIVQAQNRNFLLAEGFQRLIHKSPDGWSLFLRYQAQTERLYRRAIEDFDRLKALRHELPNEPIVDAQPEPTETACVPGQTNPSPPPHPPEHYGPDGELLFPFDSPSPRPPAQAPNLPNPRQGPPPPPPVPLA